MWLTSFHIQTNRLFCPHSHRGKVYGRSHAEEATHASFGPIKQLAAQLQYLLSEEDYEQMWLFGENLFGIHSIEYDGLGGYFYLFGVLRGTTWASWQEVEQVGEMTGIPVVPVLFRGTIRSMGDVEGWMSSRLHSERSQVGSVHSEVWGVLCITRVSSGTLLTHLFFLAQQQNRATSFVWRGVLSNSNLRDAWQNMSGKIISKLMKRGGGRGRQRS